jgi:hypothetical protein
MTRKAMQHTHEGSYPAVRGPYHLVVEVVSTRCFKYGSTTGADDGPIHQRSGKPPDVRSRLAERHRQ